MQVSYIVLKTVLCSATLVIAYIMEKFAISYT